MRQYHEIKNRFSDALVFFQVGDFYELFYEDAHKASAFLGLTLTKRGNGDQAVPLCGVPVHAIDHYLVKLVRGGFRVVLCDQLTKPQLGKLVERGVKQVLTPGTLTDLKMLEEKSASYLTSIFPIGDRYGLLFAELLAGQIFMTVLESHDTRLLEAELARFLPNEVILPSTKLATTLNQLLTKQGYTTTLVPQTVQHSPDNEELTSWLNSTFPESIITFIEHSAAAKGALALLYGYFKANCQIALAQCKQMVMYSPDDFLILDAATQRNLELVKNIHDTQSNQTLFGVLDRATTAMGSRQIKKWLLRPLVKQELIEQRLDAIQALIGAITTRKALQDELKGIGDLERVVGRIALSRAQLYDYLGLMRALEHIPTLAQHLEPLLGVQIVQAIKARLGDFTQLSEMLHSSLNDDSSLPWYIKTGYNAELDRLRTLHEQGAQAILELEKKEQERTGIPSLKIRYSKPHGYGIEITKTYLHLVPPDYIRIQTLAQRERFTYQALKDLEYDLQRAQSSIDEIEEEIFKSICQSVTHEVPALKKATQGLAHLDALLGLSDLAYERSYIRPTFNKQRNILIRDGRHPVVDNNIQTEFIPNDTALTDQECLWVITGPNMGGKSTFLRQNALIIIMAQMGSFVPAKSACLPLIDRIFTRIGAADNVAAGESTFFVEMKETALICTQATAQSLVILDEVGRGTSTYDGLALAQAIVEYLYTHVQARCLFATHYHELTSLVETHPGIAAYYAASKETKDGVLLLHKILKGKADGSFGLEVAKRAGIPEAILQRAHEILVELKQNAHTVQHDESVQPAVSPEVQKIAQELQSVNLDTLSPRQAWEFLSHLKNEYPSV